MTEDDVVRASRSPEDDASHRVVRRAASRSGLSLSAIGFGCWYPDDVMRTAEAQEEMVAAIRGGLDRGISLVDSSSSYGPDGQSEFLLGRALSGRRDEAIILTKFGVRTPDSGDGRLFTAGFGATMRIQTDPDRIPGFLESSLRRLGVDYIDIYCPHFPDPGVPIEEVVGAVAGLVAAGKVRYVGLCNVDANLLRRAHVVHPIAIVENQYSVGERTPETDTLPACRELGVDFVAWAPLARGMAANIAGYRPGHGRLSDGTEQRLEEGLSAHQLALAWLRQRAPDVIPIPGMQTRDHLDANLLALDTLLDEATTAELDAAPWEPQQRPWLAEYRDRHG